jgi:serpin B
VISRRNAIVLAGLSAAGALAGCDGIGAGGPPTLKGAELVRADLPRTVLEGSTAEKARTAAVAAISAFSAELFASLAASTPGNLICSPYSVAMALGMTVQGAKGVTARQILDVLHTKDASGLAEGLNVIDRVRSARSRKVPDPGGGKPGRVELTSANGLWGQRGVPWEQAFLEVLARDFGTGLRVLDYAKEEAARSAINGWVSGQTHERIPELVPSGVLTADTRLTLVNALYFKAPWQKPFKPDRTHRAAFHRLDGSTVDTDLMSGDGDRFASGPGWVAADLPYAGGELAMTVVVPDAGRFAEVEKGMTGEWLADLWTGLQPAPVRVELPRWKDRSQVSLGDALAGMGMPLAFTTRADFTAMTTSEPLRIAKVLHEGYIAVDEAGTEAAAATASVVETVSAPANPQSVIADRPFLYLIHDLPTATLLFIGRVLSPVP